MTELNSPETFAAVVAGIDDYLRDFRFRPQANPDTPLRRLVAAHEREVAELKEALRTVLKYLSINCNICKEECEMQLSFGTATVDNCELFKRARAALEKTEAKGESK